MWFVRFYEFQLLKSWKWLPLVLLMGAIIEVRRGVQLNSINFPQSKEQIFARNRLLRWRGKTSTQVHQLQYVQTISDLKIMRLAYSYLFWHLPWIFFAFQLLLGPARPSVTKQRGRIPYIARAQLLPSSHSTSLSWPQRLFNIPVCHENI